MDFEYKINFQQYSEESKADVIIVQGEAFTFKATGLTRRVFVNADKTKVIKVPIEKASFHWNTEEINCWNEASDTVKSEMAETEILKNGYIIQEYLHTLDDEETEEWLGRDMTMAELRLAKECRNDVGYDKDGKLKCFDLHEYKKY